MNIITDIRSLLSKDKNKKYPKILFFIFCVSVLELFSIALILPLIGFILNPNFIDTIDINFIKSIFYSFGRINFILISVIFFIFSILVKNLSIYLLYKKIFNFIYNVEGETSNFLLTEYLKKPYLFFVNNNSGLLINNLTQEIYKFNDVLLNSFFLINECMIVIGIIGLLLTVNFQITIFLVIIFFIFGILFIKLYKNKSEVLGKELVGYEGQRIKILNEIFNSTKDLILYGAKNFFINTYKENYKGSIRIRTYQTILRNLPKLFIETIVIFFISLIIFYSVNKNIDLNIFLPQIALFVICAIRLIPSINKASYAFQILNFGRATITLLKKEIKNIEEDKADISNIELVKLNKSIKLLDVKFKYEKSKIHQHYSNILIKKNTFTGILGKSGTGKSTLLNIILGLIPINDGKIFIDDLEISNKENLLRGWRRNIGYVPQSIYLLDDTLEANIAFGIKKNEINRDKLEKAIKLSKVDEFADLWTKKYQTIIGEKGGRVSGGQLQRIGIARALYNDPEVLILDEATSSLDHNLEKEIIEILFNLKKFKTVIIVTHRSTNLDNCDQIIDLNKIK
mgnify:CR=1 FL=1|tara:strand:- start:10817 stop:12526 length:1710 start_codon:yes stop_codon:yes gene_type:complete